MSCNRNKANWERRKEDYQEQYLFLLTIMTY